MPLKLAIALRVWLPIVAIATYFAFRLPTQADGAWLEIVAAMVVIPALTLLAAWSAAELMFRPAALKVETIIDDALGEPTEPMLLTHEYQPVSGELFSLPDDYHTGHLSLYNSNLLKAFGRDYPVLGAKHAAVINDPAKLFHALGGKHRLTEEITAIRTDVD